MLPRKLHKHFLTFFEAHERFCTFRIHHRRSQRKIECPHRQTSRQIISIPLLILRYTLRRKPPQSGRLDARPKGRSIRNMKLRKKMWKGRGHRRHPQRCELTQVTANNLRTAHAHKILLRWTTSNCLLTSLAPGPLPLPYLPNSMPQQPLRYRLPTVLRTLWWNRGSLLS